MLYEVITLLLFLTHIIIAVLIFVGKRNARPVGYYMNKKGIKVFLGKRILESSAGHVILDDGTEIEAA